MNTLVVGGAGFLGSHLVDRLIAEGTSKGVVRARDGVVTPEHVIEAVKRVRGDDVVV